jgi:hypothetical protein
VTVRRMTAARPLSVRSLSPKIQALCGGERVALGDQGQPDSNLVQNLARAGGSLLYYEG